MALGPIPRRPRGRGPIRFDRIAKPGGGVRTLSLLDPIDAVAFARAVARVTPFVQRRLRSMVLSPPIDPRGSLAPWRPARVRWTAEIDRRLRVHRPPVAAIADVRDCYGSIQDRPIGSYLRDAGAGADEVAAILDLIGAFQDEGVVGLPVGPPPSTVLANAVLSVVDEALVAAGLRHVRWVDDVVVFAPDPRGARAAIDLLRRSLAKVGLELNDAKTRVIGDPVEARAMLIARPPSLAPDRGMA
jgi:Reverse transcriptase (RNA-dependent DNA polymerase)